MTHGAVLGLLGLASGDGPQLLRLLRSLGAVPDAARPQNVLRAVRRLEAQSNPRARTKTEHESFLAAEWTYVPQHLHDTVDCDTALDGDTISDMLNAAATGSVDSIALLPRTMVVGDVVNIVRVHRRTSYPKVLIGELLTRMMSGTPDLPVLRLCAKKLAEKAIALERSATKALSRGRGDADTEDRVWSTAVPWTVAIAPEVSPVCGKRKNDAAESAAAPPLLTGKRKADALNPVADNIHGALKGAGVPRSRPSAAAVPSRAVQKRNAEILWSAIDYAGPNPVSGLVSVLNAPNRRAEAIEAVQNCPATASNTGARGPRCVAQSEKDEARTGARQQK